MALNGTNLAEDADGVDVAIWLVDEIPAAALQAVRSKALPVKALKGQSRLQKLPSPAESMQPFCIAPQPSIVSLLEHEATSQEALQLPGKAQSPQLISRTDMPRCALTNPVDRRSLLHQLPLQVAPSGNLCAAHPDLHIRDCESCQDSPLSIPAQSLASDLLPGGQPMIAPYNTALLEDGCARLLPQPLAPALTGVCSSAAYKNHPFAAETGNWSLPKSQGTVTVSHPCSASLDADVMLQDHQAKRALSQHACQKLSTALVPLTLSGDPFSQVMSYRCLPDASLIAPSFQAESPARQHVQQAQELHEFDAEPAEHPPAAPAKRNRDPRVRSTSLPCRAPDNSYYPIENVQQTETLDPSAKEHLGLVNGFLPEANGQGHLSSSQSPLPADTFLDAVMAYDVSALSPAVPTDSAFTSMTTNAALEGSDGGLEGRLAVIDSPLQQNHLPCSILGLQGDDGSTESWDRLAYSQPTISDKFAADEDKQEFMLTLDKSPSTRGRRCQLTGLRASLVRMQGSEQTTDVLAILNFLSHASITAEDLWNSRIADALPSLLQHDDRDVRIIADQLMESWQPISFEASCRPKTCSADVRTALQLRRMNPSWTHQSGQGPSSQQDPESSDDGRQEFACSSKQPVTYKRLVPSRPTKGQLESTHAQDSNAPCRQSNKRPVAGHQLAQQVHRKGSSTDDHRSPLRTVPPEILSGQIVPMPPRKRIKAGTRKFAQINSEASPSAANWARTSPLHQNDSKAAAKSKRVHPLQSLREVLSPASLQQHAVLTSVAPAMRRVEFVPKRIHQGRNDWSAKEKLTYVNVVLKHGKDWEKLCAAFPSRDETAVKKFWTNHHKRLRLEQLLQERPSLDLSRVH
ncbi:hypothetical protein WJX74_006922 [Apatococcus lobatus]|uniref:Myb-like domain-containing protein n=1 Tax=Apatococcus lobatus TaxID=904363 RepID=A0AAW1S3U2_9CHLO